MPFKKTTCEGCARTFEPRNSVQRAAQKCGSCMFTPRSAAPVVLASDPATPSCVVPLLPPGGKRIAVIPDTQVQPGVSFEYLSWVGQYIAEKRPDIIVHLGDHADMKSLCSYEKGQRKAEGRRYADDIRAAVDAMEVLTAPWRKVAGYHPEMHLTLGNHEDRITRAAEQDPTLYGTIGLKDLQYESFGWTVHDFLQPVELQGIEFAHYFTTGVMGRAATSAAAMLRARQQSCIQGHVQFFDVAVHQKTLQTAIMAGTCYLHDEDYLGPQGNTYKRQILVLHEANEGLFDLMTVSIAFLAKKFGGF